MSLITNQRWQNEQLANLKGDQWEITQSEEWRGKDGRILNRARGMWDNMKHTKIHTMPVSDIEKGKIKKRGKLIKP